MHQQYLNQSSLEAHLFMTQLKETNTMSNVLEVQPVCDFLILNIHGYVTNIEQTFSGNNKIKAWHWKSLGSTVLSNIRTLSLIY